MAASKQDIAEMESKFLGFQTDVSKLFAEQKETFKTTCKEIEDQIKVNAAAEASAARQSLQGEIMRHIETLQNELEN